MSLFYPAYCENCKKSNLFDLNDGSFLRIERKESGSPTMDVTGIDLCLECWAENMDQFELFAYNEGMCYCMCNCSLCHTQIANMVTGKMFAVVDMKSDSGGWKYAFCFDCFEKTIGIYKEKDWDLE